MATYGLQYDRSNDKGDLTNIIDLTGDFKTRFKFTYSNDSIIQGITGNKSTSSNIVRLNTSGASVLIRLSGATSTLTFSSALVQGNDYTLIIKRVSGVVDITDENDVSVVTSTYSTNNTFSVDCLGYRNNADLSDMLFHEFNIEDNGVTVLNLENTTGTGNSWLDTSGNNDLDLVGFPTDDSQWVLLSGGGSPIIAIDPIDQTQSIEQVTLTQQSSISIGCLAQAQSIEQVSLQANGTLSLNNLEQIQSIEQVNLTQAHIISVNSIEQLQELDPVSLLVAGTLSVNDTSQTQTLEQTVLSVIASLAISDITQAQEVEQVILTAFNGSAVSITSIDQAQNIGSVTLSQLNVVSVDNLSQSQLLQSVNFNGVVVGYLQGVLTVISAYNGRIKLTNPLTGEIRIL